MSNVILWALTTAFVAAPIIGESTREKLVRPTPPKQTRIAQASRPATSPSATPKLAKYEPARGVYLGAALDFSKLPEAGDNTSKFASIMRGYEAEVGREQAIYTQFFPFPGEDGAFPGWDSHPQNWATAKDFSEASNQLGAVPLLTLEPFKPRPFVDGWKPGAPAYEATKSFAQGAGAWGKPLFIRFAHEMNGSWYPWAEWMDKNKNLQRDPGEETGFTAADYQKAYRNVAQLFRQYAPNAALVWCPNSGLLGGPKRDVFRPFYPGDDVVDWVGLDIYERGWTMPMPGAKLWGGMLDKNLTSDAADDPKTAADESVNFYRTFAVAKNKPLMLAETSASLSYRTDLPEEQRATLSYLWRTGRWNDAEYGWMQMVYGTTAFKAYPLLHPIDRDFPKLKAITWFHVAKHETIPVEKAVGDKKQVIWFDDAYGDYRMGASGSANGPRPFLKEEITLFQRLTDTPYFLTKLQG